MSRATPRTLLLAVALVLAGHRPGVAATDLSSWPRKTPAAKAPAGKKGSAKIPAKAPPKAKIAVKPKAKAKAKPVAKEPPLPKGKLAVFTFDGESTGGMRSRVVRVLRSNGFKVMTSLRPVDSAEQYRDLAATLGLAAYVDGDVQDDGEACSATINVRSGATGLRVASATFSGERRKIADDIGKSLWIRVGPSLQRARADAAKPRKLGNAPLRIDAGQPL